MINYTKWLTSLVLIILLSSDGFSCSMYKISKDGKTVVGSNEDAWRTTPHIWFENGINGSYGCCFTGSRRIGNNKYAAQSGMNEHGLTFARLTSYHPVQQTTESKKPIENPDMFLMNILKTSKNIDEVYAELSLYDRTCFLEDVFVYIEPSGDYLIVEPYQLIKGSDSTFVQANFCPSITTEEDRRKQDRYRKGKDFLTGNCAATAEFCRKLSSEMHVCRDKIGDGTLLTSIWDTKNLEVTLYFYHNYSENVAFNLKEELMKGDHQLAITELFSGNAEFAQLENYVTPFNTNWIRITLALFGFIFLLSGIFFGASSLRKKSKEGSIIRILLFFVLTLSCAYMFILATNINVYYFPAPYLHHSSISITLSSYIPILIICLLLVLTFLHWKKKYFKNWSKFSGWILILNSSILTGLVFAFFYWGLLPF